MTTVSAAVDEVLAESAGAAPFPEFAQRFMTDWRGAVAHAILFVGNITDYAGAGETTPEFLEHVLCDPNAGKLRSVARYMVTTTGRQIVFRLPSMLEDFVRVTGIKVAVQEGQTELRAKSASESVGLLLEFLASARACTACEQVVRPAPPEAIVKWVTDNLQQRPGALSAESSVELREGVCTDCLIKGKTAVKPDAANRQVAGVIIEDLEILCPPADIGGMNDDRREVLGMLKRAGANDQLELAGNPLLMLASAVESVHPDLRSAVGVSTIDVPLPDMPQRRAYIEGKIARTGIALGPGVTPYTLAVQTAGLSLRGIEDIFLRARVSPTKTLTMELADTRKAELIKTDLGGLLEVRKPRGGWSRIGAQTEFKDWSDTWLIGPLKSEDPEIRAASKVSILLDGPPGTGKTVIAEAIAAELGWPLLIYGEGRDSLVGETEKNDAKRERVVRANLPAVIFWDEIDQMGKRVTGGSGGGGDQVEAGLFRRQLLFMADPTLRGQCIIIGASNRPDQIDDAMASRFEVRAPILYPDTPEATADVLVTILRNHGVADVDPDMLMPIAEKLDEWAPRDLEQSVIKALGLMRIKKMPLLDAIAHAFRTRKPMERADAKEMRDLAILDCNDVELLPARYRREMDEMDVSELRDKVTKLREKAPRERGQRF